MLCFFGQELIIDKEKPKKSDALHVCLFIMYNSRNLITVKLSNKARPLALRWWCDTRKGLFIFASISILLSNVNEMIQSS